MYMYKCMYMFLYIYVCMYAYMYTCIYVCINMYVYMYIYIYMYRYMCIYIHALVCLSPVCPEVTEQHSKRPNCGAYLTTDRSTPLSRASGFAYVILQALVETPRKEADVFQLSLESTV